MNKLLNLRFLSIIHSPTTWWRWPSMAEARPRSPQTGSWQGGRPGSWAPRHRAGAGG